MTPDLLTLAAFVVALPGWRWMPGMLTTDGDRVHDAIQMLDGRWHLHMTSGVTITNARNEHDGWCRVLYSPVHEREVIHPSDAPLPDLDDAATGGCMLAMLGRCEVYMFAHSVEVHHISTAAVGHGATLAESCARVALARGMWSS